MHTAFPLTYAQLANDNNEEAGSGYVQHHGCAEPCLPVLSLSMGHDDALYTIHPS